MKPNSLEKFQQVSVGSKRRLVDFLPKVSSSGDLQKVLDLQAVVSSWNNILITPLRSCSFDPEFGSELYRLVFDPADEITMEKIENEVRNRLMSFDDRAMVTDVKIDFLSNKKGFVVNVTVRYENQRSQVSATINDSMMFNK